jgi:hypothetical protein
LAGIEAKPSLSKDLVFSIDDYIANISLYALNRLKLNFGCYLALKFTAQSLKISLKIAKFETLNYRLPGNL